MNISPSWLINMLVARLKDINYTYYSFSFGSVFTVITLDLLSLILYKHQSTRTLQSHSCHLLHFTVHSSSTYPSPLILYISQFTYPRHTRVHSYSSYLSPLIIYVPPSMYSYIPLSPLILYIPQSICPIDISVQSSSIYISSFTI